MIKLDPNTLYSLNGLREMLHGIVELDTVLDRLGLRDRRVFRDAIWGWEILEASRKAEPFSEQDQLRPNIRDIAHSATNPRGKSSRIKDSPLQKFSARDLVE